MNDISTAEYRDHSPTIHAHPDPWATMIERVVLDPAVDIEKMERMLAMKERMDERNAKISFADALSAARSEIPPIIKDATVDFTSSKGRTHYQHETLAGIAKTIDQILSRHGLSYRFRTNQQGGLVMVTCIISHRDGYSEETALSGSPDQSGSKNGFQAVGSAVTYLQRYTLKAALGLSAEVDDDGHAAAIRQDPRREPVRDFDLEVQDAIRAMSRETAMESLSAYFTDLFRRARDVAEDPRVVLAKDEAKDRLSRKSPADLGGDKIPY